MSKNIVALCWRKARETGWNELKLEAVEKDACLFSGTAEGGFGGYLVIYARNGYDEVVNDDNLFFADFVEYLVHKLLRKGYKELAEKLAELEDVKMIEA